MARSVLRRPSRTADQLDRSLGADLARHVRGDSVALALYGSRAMGNHRSDSDTDILQIVNRRPGSYVAGALSISAYLPQTLMSMSQRGSLFILHLKQDGVVILDHRGVLGHVLDAYRHPTSYEPLLIELRAAASALRPVKDSERYAANLRKLSFYLLRTALYARTSEIGRPTFDVDRAATLVDIRGLDMVLARRHQPSRQDDAHELYRHLELLLGDIPPNPWNSVEALSVALTGERPYAAALLAQSLYLAPTEDFEYTALTPPPL
jgi:hypothetical protein